MIINFRFQGHHLVLLITIFLTQYFTCTQYVRNANDDYNGHGQTFLHRVAFFRLLHSNKQVLKSLRSLFTLNSQDARSATSTYCIHIHTTFAFEKEMPLSFAVLESMYSCCVFPPWFNPLCKYIFFSAKFQNVLMDVYVTRQFMIFFYSKFGGQKTCELILENMQLIFKNTGDDPYLLHIHISSVFQESTMLQNIEKNP